MSFASGPSLHHAAYTWAAHGGGFGNQTVADKVPPEMLHMIDPHWYQFPPMNPLWHALLGFVIGVLGVVSFIGNGMVIYIFTSAKSLRTPSNLLVVNLAISDFLMMLSLSPAMVRIYATFPKKGNTSAAYICIFHHCERCCAGDQLLLRDVGARTLIL